MTIEHQRTRFCIFLCVFIFFSDVPLPAAGKDTSYTVMSIVVLLVLFSLFWYIRMRLLYRALHESERSKSILIENLPGMAYKCRFDTNWTMKFVSRGCKELTGYTSEEITDNAVISYNDIIHPDDREGINQSWLEACLNNTPAELEYRIITADKTVKWVYEKGIVVREGHDKLDMIEGIIIDISERKAVEQELIRISKHDHFNGC